MREAIKAYKGKEPYIFISYAHRDAELVRPILDQMDAHGFRLWYDAGIDPGTEWDENIARHIKQCDTLIAFISGTYLRSENCKDELNYARDRARKRLLVYLEDVLLPDGMEMRLSRLQAIDLALWFEGDILLGANAVARASGLNLLLPYADRRMVDLATRVPADLRLKDGCGKYVLRKAAQRRLPDEVAFRAKVGFSVPIRVWMREEARREEIESVLFGSSSLLFFNKAMVRSYWESFLDGNDYLWHIVYALYVFLIWYRECFS